MSKALVWLGLVVWVVELEAAAVVVSFSLEAPVPCGLVLPVENPVLIVNGWRLKASSLLLASSNCCDKAWCLCSGVNWVAVSEAPGGSHQLLEV